MPGWTLQKFTAIVTKSIFSTLPSGRFFAYKAPLVGIRHTGTGAIIRFSSTVSIRSIGRTAIKLFATLSTNQIIAFPDIRLRRSTILQFGTPLSMIFTSFFYIFPCHNKSPFRSIISLFGDNVKRIAIGSEAYLPMFAAMEAA